MINRDTGLIDRLLDVVVDDIVPLTSRGVARGNKVFGAAILKKSDHSLVVAETNNEMESPLWHAEVHALKRFYELPKPGRPDIKDCVFLATHEPCPLCLSAITWTGFDNFYYLFSHEATRDAFAIPHDLRILREVFRLEPGGYNADNVFWKSYSIPQAASRLPAGDRGRLQARIAEISARYEVMSRTYQNSKSNNDVPLS